MSSSLTILMTCCAGFSAWETSAPRGPLLDGGDEGPDHGQRDIGLEQRDADLARGGVDVGVGEPALAAQAGEDLVQAVGEGLEHSTSSEVTGAAIVAPSDSQGIERVRRLRGRRTRRRRPPTSPMKKAEPQSAQAHSGHSPPSSVCPSVQGGWTNHGDLATGRAGPQSAVHGGSSRRGTVRPVPATVARPTDRTPELTRRVGLAELLGTGSAGDGHERGIHPLALLGVDRLPRRVADVEESTASAPRVSIRAEVTSSPSPVIAAASRYSSPARSPARTSTIPGAAPLTSLLCHEMRGGADRTPSWR